MDLRLELDAIISSQDLSPNLDDDELAKLGNKLVNQFEDDLDTRADWQDRADYWLKLATQLVEKKSFPWPDAANIKYPLLTTAAMQFGARAYPDLVPGANLVSGQVIGRDTDGTKYQRSKRVAAHMSYQLLNEMDKWEEDMDRLCMILPILGLCFKKTYFDVEEQKNVSKLVLPQDLIIHYYAESVEKSARKFHKIQFSANEIFEKRASGIFRDVDLGKPNPYSDKASVVKDLIDGNKPPSDDEDTPHDFIEAHVLEDLDGDGYKEPWIITVHLQTRHVVRIIARFTSADVVVGKKGIVKIKPIEYFTKFGFIPNPDGSLYDLGFGILLGGINETVNTLTNQLIDSGTLNNLQAGFLGRGIRVRGGNSKFSPGEWKSADFTGDDIRKHIFALPTKEPSDVLFKLLEALVLSGKELASIAEIMVGKMPGQNTPATTTMAAIEQGEKVFTAIYKRIWRSLGEEYKKLYRLNSLHLPDETLYYTINQPEGPQGQQVEKTDYVVDVSVKPAADPNASSKAARLMRRQAESGLIQLGTINPQVFTKRFLEDLDEENIQELMTVPPPKPSEKELAIQQKEASDQRDAALESQKLELEAAIAARDSAIESQKLELERQRVDIEQLKVLIETKMEVASIHADIANAILDREHDKEKEKVKNERGSKE